MPITIRKNAIKLKDGAVYFNADVFSAESAVVLNTVTPEMFGAVGDGIADDTSAWQNAVNSGKDVVALSKQYKCGKITVSKNISIDCQGASFNCTETQLFDCTGTITKTLTSQTDYSANEKGYNILSQEDSDYTGFAMLQGTNNFVENRTYYRGGFVCSFNDGEMNNSYPIDVENTTILLIDPITVTLKNIGNIIYIGSSSSNKNWIRITYGVNCLIEKCDTHILDFYTFIEFSNCLNCVAKNLYVIAETGTTGTNSYLVALNNSSFCCIQDSYLYNKFWHCITTGDTYLCFKNLIKNSVLLNNTSGGFVDHDNGIGTILRDCVIAGCVLGTQGVIDNVSIISIDNANKTCELTITQPTNKALSGATVSNLTFYPDDTCNGCGIQIYSYTQGVTGKTFYIDNIKIDHVRVNSDDITGNFRFGFGTNLSDDMYWVIKKILFNDCDLTIDLTCTNPNADTSNMVAKKTVYENV